MIVTGASANLTYVRRAQGWPARIREALRTGKSGAGALIGSAWLRFSRRR